MYVRVCVCEREREREREMHYKHNEVIKRNEMCLTSYRRLLSIQIHF